MSGRDLAQQLEEKGYRYTQPRQVILDLLRAATCHPDANWVYDHARAEIPHISLGTVYRTLGVLVDAGLVRELRGAGSHARYDGDIARHHHVICRRCGAVADVRLELSEQLNDTVAVETGYVIEERRVDFYGLCPMCSADPDDQALPALSRDCPD